MTTIVEEDIDVDSITDEELKVMPIDKLLQVLSKGNQKSESVAGLANERFPSSRNMEVIEHPNVMYQRRLAFYDKNVNEEQIEAMIDRNDFPTLSVITLFSKNLTLKQMLNILIIHEENLKESNISVFSKSNNYSSELLEYRLENNFSSSGLILRSPVRNYIRCLLKNPTYQPKNNIMGISLIEPGEMSNESIKRARIYSAFLKMFEFNRVLKIRKEYGQTSNIVDFKEYDDSVKTWGNKPSYEAIKLFCNDHVNFDDFLKLDNSYEKQAFVLNENIDEDILHKLASENDLEILMAVAYSENTNSQTLKMLSNHKDIAVRTLVANHKNTDSETLYNLYKYDSNSDVSYSALLNSNFPKSKIQELMKEKSTHVDLARSEALSFNDCLTLIESDNILVKFFALNNPNMPSMYKNLHSF